MASNPRYRALINEVCVGLGFCGGVVDGEPRHVDDYIPEAGPVTVDEFITWLLMAEGLDPSPDEMTWRKHGARLREVFVRHMGAEQVDASALKWA